MRSVRAWPILAALALVAVVSSAPARAAGPAAAPVPPEWLTPVERSGFEATPSYDETVAFLKRLAKKLPLEVAFYGTSGQGRPLPVAILSKDRDFTPEAAARRGKPVVLVVCGIHSGEIDGKDAMLILLRDMALGRHAELLEAGTLLFVPIFNVDGHERVSPYNRPNQDGPRAGMGFRTNAAGLDLNRDHMKAASPEMRALIGLFNRWRPHLHVDNHVTDGCEFEWTLTYGTVEAPQVAPTVDAWLRAHLPGALAATERAGFGAGPYVSLLDGADPSKGFESFTGGARFSTGYFGLRNRPSILVEMHSYKPYRQRVLGNKAFLAGLLDEVRRAPGELVEAVRAAERRVVAAGKPDAPPSDIVLGWTESKQADRILFPVYEWTPAVSTATGRPMAQYTRGVVKAIEVPWLHRPEALASTPRPRGYYVLPGWPQIEERLATHGLVVHRLSAPFDAPVEVLRVDGARLEGRSYQGHVGMTATVDRRAETRRLPAGTLWIPADQPDFELAAQLLEPASPDSLYAWGLLASIGEQKEYIDTRVLEGHVKKMLEDPAIAAEWDKALADPAFAKDGRARYEWWYKRTPFYDKTIGEMPLFRATAPPPGVPMTAWPRP